MAIYKKGADPVALRAAAERLSAHARDCDGVRAAAGGAMRSLRGQWGGADLEHLMGQWPPLEAQLASFGTDLGRLAEALRRNAGQQDETSGLGGSGGLGGPLGPGGVPGMPGPAGPGAPGAPGAQPGDEVPDSTRLLGGLGLGLTVAGLPGLFAQSAAFASVFSRADGFLASGRYLSNVTSMLRAADPMLELMPGATRFAAGAGFFADAWNMNGLGGLFAEGSRAGSFVGKFGVLGPIGIGVSGLATIDSIVHGDTRGAIENGLGTALMTGAVFAPPPANIACGIAGLGLAAYQNIPAVHETVDAIGEGVADVAEGIGDAAKGAWDTVSGWF